MSACVNPMSTCMGGITVYTQSAKCWEMVRRKQARSSEFWARGAGDIWDVFPGCEHLALMKGLGLPCEGKVSPKDWASGQPSSRSQAQRERAKSFSSPGLPQARPLFLTYGKVGILLSLGKSIELMWVKCQGMKCSPGH